MRQGSQRETLKWDFFPIPQIGEFKAFFQADRVCSCSPLAGGGMGAWTCFWAHLQNIE